MKIFKNILALGMVLFLAITMSAQNYKTEKNNGTAEGRLYWDAGNGWEFRNGDYSLMTFKAQKNGKKVNVALASTEGDRDVASEIKNVEVIVVEKGKTRTGRGNLADGITVKL